MMATPFLPSDFLNDYVIPFLKDNLFIYLWLCWIFTEREIFSSWSKKELFFLLVTEREIFFSWSKQELFFLLVHGLLSVVTSLVVEQRL